MWASYGVSFESILEIKEQHYDKTWLYMYQQMISKTLEGYWQKTGHHVDWREIWHQAPQNGLRWNSVHSLDHWTRLSAEIQKIPWLRQLYDLVDRTMCLDWHYWQGDGRCYCVEMIYGYLWICNMQDDDKLIDSLRPEQVHWHFTKMFSIEVPGTQQSVYVAKLIS